MNGHSNKINGHAEKLNGHDGVKLPAACRPRAPNMPKKEALKV